jgi:DNA-binding LacI/PurR family transcriptional regulator
MSANHPTIKEIALRLNVSISTVSRALHDHPRIGIKTKERVKALAREMKYEPNAQAIFFKQQKTAVIGVVLPSIKEEFFSQAISGIEAAATQYDYTILFGQSHDDPAIEKRVVESMKRQRVDGIIISLSNRVPDQPDVHKVYCDIYKSTIDMVNWLYSRGYRKIAMINGPANLTASRERLEGYKQALSQKKMKIDMRYFESTDLTKEGTTNAIKKLLSLKNRPSAIISFNDYVHMDATQYAHLQGMKINADIAFVSYSNLSITDYTAFPPLLSVEQYPYGQGEQAMETMIRTMKEEHIKDIFYHEEVPATLVIHSTKQLR